jgi:hypothetical protein
MAAVLNFAWVIPVLVAAAAVLAAVKLIRMVRR